MIDLLFFFWVFVFILINALLYCCINVCFQLNTNDDVTTICNDCSISSPISFTWKIKCWVFYLFIFKFWQTNFAFCCSSHLIYCGFCFLLFELMNCPFLCDFTMHWNILQHFCRFFSPTISYITSRGHNLHILCLSIGNTLSSIQDLFILVF